MNGCRPIVRYRMTVGASLANIFALQSATLDGVIEAAGGIDGNGTN